MLQELFVECPIESFDMRIHLRRTGICVESLELQLAHARSKWRANSEPLSVCTAPGSQEGRRCISRGNPMRTSCRGWYILRRNAVRFSVSMPVTMYRLIPSTNRTTVSTSSTRYPLGRRIFFRYGFTPGSIKRPVFPESETFRDDGRSPLSLRPAICGQLVETLPEYPSAFKSAWIFSLPMLGWAVRRADDASGKLFWYGPFPATFGACCPD